MNIYRNKKREKALKKDQAQNLKKQRKTESSEKWLVPDAHHDCVRVAEELIEGDRSLHQDLNCKQIPL